MTNYPVIFEAKLAVVELSYGKFSLRAARIAYV